MCPSQARSIAHSVHEQDLLCREIKEEFLERISSCDTIQSSGSNLWHLRHMVGLVGIDLLTTDLCVRSHSWTRGR